MGASCVCKPTAQGARESHLCADQRVLRKRCLGRTVSPSPVWDVAESDAWTLTNPSPRVRGSFLTPSSQSSWGLVSGQLAKGGGGGRGRVVVKWKRGRFSTNPKPETGIFEILTNPKPELGTRCSKASNLYSTA